MHCLVVKELIFSVIMDEGNVCLSLCPDYMYAVTIKSIGSDQQEPQERPNDSKKAGNIKIVSVGQFRPEKDHPLQLRAMYELQQLVSEDMWDKVSKL
jgi:hypothetical protein